MSLEETKKSLVALIASGKTPGSVKNEFGALLDTAATQGMTNNDPLMMIGASVYGYAPKQESKLDPNTPAPVIIPFDYMQAFMKDVLEAYGVPEKEVNK